MKESNFVWEMNEEKWKELMEDHGKKDDPEFDKNDDFYGSIYVGNLCAEIMHTYCDPEWYAFSNVYALGIDDGYGKTKSGVPYTLLNDAPVIPMNAETFEEFKEMFEKSFEEYIHEDKKRTELAEMPLGKW